MTINAHDKQDVTNKSVPCVEPTSYNLYEQLVIDARGFDFSFPEESPNAVAQKLFDVLRANNQEVLPGYENHSHHWLWKEY